MNEVITYSADGVENFPVLIDQETIWLTQAQIAELFGTKRPAITKHLGNIYASGELRENSTCSEMEQVRKEGGRTIRRQIERYNLDAIIAVGYRVNSMRATQFRMWATNVLREHLLKGYTVKQPVSVEQLSGIKDEIQELANEVKEMLKRQDNMDSFVYEEFGRVYEIISSITEQKKRQESQPRRRIGF
ncbi:MAG: virulence RhuM family protein [Prevotellaceae bacterium]|jgi:hypothetical protein|nr:virulence RhuM family protein [Prevotellaceae bacterium]